MLPHYYGSCLIETYSLKYETNLQKIYTMLLDVAEVNEAEKLH